jgi:prefoldin subunit 5
MLDPASIAAICGVTVKLCSSVAPAVLDFRNFLEGAKHVDTAISALLREIEDFKNILETLKRTAEKPEVRVLIEASGNTGDQWYKLKLSLDDAKTTLVSLEETVKQRVDKDVALLDKERKKIRLNKARDEITTYQQQLRSCKDLVQVVLQATVMYVHWLSVDLTV